MMESLDAVRASLDPEQREAVDTTALRVRVLAAAGSGKTRSILGRIAVLLARGVQAPRILTVTFSRHATAQLRERLGPIGDRVHVSTLHALGLAIVRTDWPWVKVADTALSMRLIRQAMSIEKTGEKLAEVTQAIRGAKVHGRLAGGPVAQRYETLLRESRHVDFDDLLLRARQFLRTVESKAAKKWIGFFHHVLVDEMQDTSGVQVDILALLLTPETGLFVVGDCSQAVYGFRGARPDVLLDGMDARFGTSMVPVVTYGLPRNYRSAPGIVSLANTLMRGQPGALELLAQRDLAARVDVVEGATATEEAQGILTLMMHEVQGGPLRWEDAVVLTRTNAQHEAFESACSRLGVPYHKLGGIGFYDRMEVLDVLAYLTLSQAWDAEALERIYNRPSRYLGKAWRAELETQGGWAMVQGGPPLTFSREYMGRAVADLRAVVVMLQRANARGSCVHEIAQTIVDGPVGYRTWLIGESPDDADDVKSEILDAFLVATERDATVAEFLTFVTRCQSRGRKRTAAEGITLSTVHRYKGLEAPCVAVAGLTKDLLPHKHGDPAEERRIAYVAVTRARDWLILGTSGLPSPFLRELRGQGVVPPAVAPLFGAENADGTDEEETSACE